MKNFEKWWKFLKSKHNYKWQQKVLYYSEIHRKAFALQESEVRHPLLFFPFFRCFTMMCSIGGNLEKTAEICRATGTQSAESAWSRGIGRGILQNKLSRDRDRVSEASSPWKTCQKMKKTCPTDMCVHLTNHHESPITMNHQWRCIEEARGS